MIILITQCLQIARKEFISSPLFVEKFSQKFYLIFVCVCVINTDIKFVTLMLYTVPWLQSFVDESIL